MVFPENIGQVAYEKWVSLLTIRPPLTWEDMPQEGKDAWREIAKTVIIATGYGVKQ